MLYCKMEIRQAADKHTGSFLVDNLLYWWDKDSQPLGWGTFFKGGAQVHVKKTMEEFFNNRFSVTMDSILIVLLFTYVSNIQNLEVGDLGPHGLGSTTLDKDLYRVW